jgi:hypothetical protein
MGRTTEVDSKIHDEETSLGKMSRWEGHTAYLDRRTREEEGRAGKLERRAEEEAGIAGELEHR